MGKQIIIKGADFSEVAINEATRYAITYALTNVSAASQPSSIIAGRTLTLQLSAASGYTLPTSVSVTNSVTGTAITSGVSYDSSTGVLTVSNVSYAITITAVGVEEDVPAGTPSLTVSPATVTLKAKAGGTATATVAIGGSYLTSDVSVSLSSNTGLSLSASQFLASQVMNGANLTITFSPSAGATPGTTTVTLTVTSNGIQSETVTLTVITAKADLEYLYEFNSSNTPPFPSDMIDNCGINATNGELAENYSLWAATNFLSIDGYTKYVLVHSHTSANNFGLAWYNSQQQYISGIKFSSSNDGFTQDGSLPSNAKYVRFCLLKNTNQGYASVSLTLKDE